MALSFERSGNIRGWIAALSNKLLKVRDGSANVTGFSDGTNSGNDYIFDVNGSMTADQNKTVDSIKYNHLNLPVRVKKHTGELLKFTYDATGRKLTQQLYNASGTLTRTTDYDGEFFYQGDTLKFIDHQEGRIVMTGASPEYQYFLKDHLGNTRLVFTTVTPPAQSVTAHMENPSSEAPNYSYYGPTVASNAYAGTHSMALTGAPYYNIGLAKSYSVMPGDQVSISGYVRSDARSGSPSGLSSFATYLLSSFGLPAPGVGETGTASAGISYFGTLEQSGYGDGSLDNTDVRAFLNILFFDKNYNFVNVAFAQVTTDGVYHSMSLSSVAKEAGYAYVYVSHEDPYVSNVFFDEMTTTLTPSNVVQLNDYYAFGLTFNSYSREGSVDQKYKFNGIEQVADLGLNVLDAQFRVLDPAIGRWWQNDPKAEQYYSWSPFNAMGNNPIKISDPLGDEWKDKKDEKMAGQISNQLQKQDQRLQKQEQRLDARIAKADAKGNTSKVERLTAQKASVSQSRSDISKTQSGIAAMGADQNKTFHFNQLSEGQQVGFTSTDKDGTTVINYVNGGFGNTIHELTHASQIQQGLLKGIPGTDQVIFTGISPINAETQAYQSQYSAAPSTLPPSDAGAPTSHGGVNGDYVRGVYYNDASGKKINPYSDKMYQIKDK